MRKRIGLILALVLLSNLLILPQAYATHINGFTFLIPYSANDLEAQFEAQRSDVDADRIVITISISVLRDGTTIYYDHWEDGLERNVTSPNQSSTEEFVRDAGDVITLQNDVPVPRPDAPTDFLYDGGDLISAVGGSIAVTVAVWPEPLANPGEPGYLYAGAWELNPTSRWCNRYVIPVGVDMGTSRGGFTVVGFNVQTVEDDTFVEVFEPDGTLRDSRTLAAGEQFALVNGTNAGTQVQASAPVQVHLFTGDPGRTYEARAYTLLCRDDWAHDYLAPRSSDGDFWLYNDDGAPLDVQVETTAGTQTITIGANDFARYPPTGPVLTDRSGVRFTSSDGRPFYGLAALDADYVQDWGYALLPISNLTTQALIGWAPGNSRNPPSSYFGSNPAATDLGRRASRVYVTAATTTTLYVDFDGDGSRIVAFPVSPLEELDIVDEDDDFDMTRARLYTDPNTDGAPFIAVWGQDADAPDADPSIDVGTNIAPLRAPSIQKTFISEAEGYNCGPERQQSHVLRFDLVAFNDSATDIPDATVTDNLPPGIAYVEGSTEVDGVSIEDDTSGSPFPLDGDGINIGSLDALGSSTVSFLATVEDAGEFVNQANLSPSADPAVVDVPIPVLLAGYQVTKTLVDPPSGVVDPGQVITFNVTISNTGSTSITELPLLDEFDADVLTYSSASVEPSNIDADTGVITWDDLIASLGELTPSTPPRTLSVSFVVVDDIPSGVSSAINTAFSTGARGSDGSPQAIACAEASVNFDVPTPTPTPTPTRTPDDDDDDDDKDKPEPTPTPSTSISIPTPTPPPVPTPAVLFLPETGVGYPKNAPAWPFVVLSGFVLLLGWVVYRHRK